MTDLNIAGMAISPSVVETIVSLAASEVEGVAEIGAAPTSGIRSIFGAKPSTKGIDIVVTEEEKLEISVRLDVLYGFALPEVANKVRQAIAEAVSMQLGFEVANVDVYIDNVQFAK